MGNPERENVPLSPLPQRRLIPLTMSFKLHCGGFLDCLIVESMQEFPLIVKGYSLRLSVYISET